MQDIRQEAEGGSDAPAAGAYYKVHSCDEKGVDEEVPYCAIDYGERKY